MVKVAGNESIDATVCEWAGTWYGPATALASLGATVVASGVLTATQIDTGTPLTKTIHYNTTQITPTGSTTVRQFPNISIPSISADRDGTVDIAFGRMPNVDDFILDSKADKKILNQQTLEAYVDDIAAVLAAGGTITSVEIEAKASDEQMISSDAGLGERDRQNRILAAQRAGYIRQIFLMELERRGFSLGTDVPISVSYKEVVLDDSVVTKLKDLTKQFGFQDLRSMINAYKYGDFKPNLTNQQRRLFENALDDNRGGQITTAYQLPGKLTVTEKTIKYCNDVTSDFYAQEIEEKTFFVTVYPVPIPLFPMPKRNKDKTPQPVPRTPQGNVTATAPATRRRRKNATIQKIKRRANTVGEASKESIHVYWDDVKLLGRSAIDAAWAVVNNPIFKNGSKGIAILALAGIMTTPRASLEWCPEDPNPNDIFLSSPSKINLWLNIPFTDINSDTATIPLHSCERRVDPVVTPYVPALPTCGEETRVFVNGELKGSKTLTPPVRVFE